LTENGYSFIKTLPGIALNRLSGSANRQPQITTLATLALNKTLHPAQKGVKCCTKSCWPGLLLLKPANPAKGVNLLKGKKERLCGVHQFFVLSCSA
jgi:hypothetical protein